MPFWSCLARPGAFLFVCAKKTNLTLISFQSYMLPMTLHNMNNMKFSPRKDYDANRLVSGILQLCDGTQVVLDETAMQAGQLDANGKRTGWFLFARKCKRCFAENDLFDTME